VVTVHRGYAVDKFLWQLDSELCRSDLQVIANDCNPFRTIAVGAFINPVLHE
jgi:hypothetical protein